MHGPTMILPRTYMSARGPFCDRLVGNRDHLAMVCPTIRTLDSI